jgi:hypothetical protein
MFLLALRDRRVAAALKRYGFSDDDLEEGWSLMRQLTRGRLDAVDPEDPRLLTELDGWENHWFPVLSAVLENHFPEIHAMVFNNLAQTSGPEVVVTVGTLIERIERMSAAREEGGFGATGRSARTLLEKRGFTAEEIESARKLIQKIGKIADASELAGDEESVADDDSAETAMWKWYLEWSTIARGAIKNRRLLRNMGFLQQANGSSEEPEPPPAAGDPSAPVTPES